jgi:hypothetical protein
LRALKLRRRNRRRELGLDELPESQDGFPALPPHASISSSSAASSATSSPPSLGNNNNESNSAQSTSGSEPTYEQLFPQWHTANEMYRDFIVKRAKTSIAWKAHQKLSISEALGAPMSYLCKAIEAVMYVSWF